MSSSEDVTQSNRLYQKQQGSNLFLLKGCSYELQIEELLKYDHHEVIGKDGTYGTSYKCNTKYGAIVMKRFLNLQANNAREDGEFEQRMEEIGQIGDHPNIKLPFGYYYTQSDKFLLYEYAAAGTLKTLLQKTTTVHGTRSYWHLRLNIILGVVRGIAHVHSKVGVVHGNIKSSNVILTQDESACITDFGFAPIMNVPLATPMLKKLGFLKFSDAPELKESKEATQQTDIYNLGILLIEIVPSYDFTLLWHANVQLEMQAISRIGLECLHKDPTSRPKIEEVVRRIQIFRRLQ